KPGPVMFPAAGTSRGPAENSKLLLGLNLCLCPTSKKDRLKPIPAVKPPANKPPVGPPGGSNNYYGLPYPGLVGAGGCGPCIGVSIKCPNGIAVFHFTIGDNPALSLGLWAESPTLDWSKCTAIVCGGDDSWLSNCLADEALRALKLAKIEVEG